MVGQQERVHIRHNKAELLALLLGATTAIDCRKVMLDVEAARAEGQHDVGIGSESAPMRDVRFRALQRSSI